MDSDDELELIVLSLPLMSGFDRWTWMLKSDEELRREMLEVADRLGPLSQNQRLEAYEKWLAAERLASIVSEGRATQVASDEEWVEHQTAGPETKLLAQIGRLGHNGRVRLWRTLDPGLASCLLLGWRTILVEPEGEDLDDWLLSDSRAAVTYLLEKLWAPLSELERLTGCSPLAAPQQGRRSPLQLLEAFAELHPEASLELRRRLPLPWLRRLFETWDGQPPSGAAEDWMELANLPEVTLWQWGEVAPVDQALALLEMCGLLPESVGLPNFDEVIPLEMETFELYPLFLLSQLAAEDYQNHLQPLLSEEAQRLCPQWAVDGLRQIAMLPYLQEAPAPPWREWIPSGLEPIVLHIEQVARQRFPSEVLPPLLEAGNYDVLRQVTVSTFRHLARARKESGGPALPS